MAKKTAKQRRAAASRASEIEHSKGTSKKTLFSPQKKTPMSKKDKIILISVISTVLLAVILTCLFVFVFNGDDSGDDILTAKGISYEYSDDFGGYVVRTAGLDITEAAIPEKIGDVPVVAIAKRAFSGCSKLATISVPNSIEYIGAGAFEGCTSLKYTAYNNGHYLGNKDNPHLVLITVNKPTEPTAYNTEKATKIIYDGAFANLEKISYVLITENVTQIGAGAFSACDGLGSVSIPDSVKYVGDFAFYNCKTLASVTFVAKNPVIGSYAFAGCSNLFEFALPWGATEISDGLLQNSGIPTIHIPDTVKRIGKRAFEGCLALTMPKIPASVEIIDAYAFSGAFPFTKNENKDNEPDMNLSLIETSIKHIGDYAFEKCTDITYVDFPKTIETIGTGAFSECTNLDTVDFDPTAPLKEFANNVFMSCKNLIAVEEIPFTVTSVGEMAFYGCENLEELPIIEELEHIGFGAFAACTGLTEIILPSTLKTVGDNCFYGLPYLTSVTLPEGLERISVGMFYQCTRLTSVTLPSTVKSIGADAFGYCEALESIELNEGLESIEFGAFENCESLTIEALPSSLIYLGYIKESGIVGDSGATPSYALGSSYESYETYGGGVYAGTAENPYMILVSLSREAGENIYVHSETKAIASGAFYNSTKIKSVELPDGLLYIGDFAFVGCSGIETLEIPASVKIIENGAFYEMTALKSVTFGEELEDKSLESIGNFAFMYCTALTEIALPESVLKLGTSVFYACTSLESATLPSNIKEIPVEIFSSCTALKSVNLNDGITSVGFDAFSNCSSYTYTTDGGVIYAGTAANPYMILVSAVDKTITSYTVKTGTKIIHSSAFASCASLVSINIPSSVTEIGDGAFYACTALKSITLPSGIKSIASGLFSGCTALSSVKIGAVTQIGSYAFFGCASLTSLNVTDALLTIGEYAFSGCSMLRSFYIPKSVRTVGAFVFDGCRSLDTVKIGASFEHSGFSSTWCDQREENMTSLIRIKRGA